MGILELVVAFLILVMVLLPTAYLLTDLDSQAGNSTQRTAALAIAEQWIEQLNAQGPPLQSPSNLPFVNSYNPVPDNDPTTDNGSVTEGGITYQVRAQFTWYNSDGSTTQPNICQSTTAPLAMQVTVNVYWADAAVQVENNQTPTDTTQTVTDTTVVDWPPPSVPQYGFIAVQINGDPLWSPAKNAPAPLADVDNIAWSQRVQDVKVSVSGSNSISTTWVDTATPDSYGCAFIEAPPPSTGTFYTVSVGEPTTPLSTPFVGVGSTATPYPETLVASNVNVTVDKVTAESFQYDEGAYIDVNQPNTTLTADNFTCPNSGSIQCVSAGQSPTAGGVTASVNLLMGGTWSSQVLPSNLNMNRILGSACAAPWCISVGNGPSGGAAVFTSTSSVTIGATTYSPGTYYSGAPPAALGVTNISSIRCPSTTSCLAVGSTAGGPVILGMTISSSSTPVITWTADGVSAPALSTIKQLVCPGSTSCVAIGTSTAGAGVVLVSTNQLGTLQTWTSQTVPATGALTQLSCPAGGSACVAIGSSTAGTSGVVIAGPQGTGQWYSQTISGGSTSLTQLTCSGSTECLAVGTGAGNGPLMISGPVSGSSTNTWYPNNLGGITGIQSLTQVACSANGATPYCEAIDSTSASDGNGIIWAPLTAASPTPPAWTAATVSPDPTIPGATYINQISCPAAASFCIASGSDIWIGALSNSQNFEYQSLPSGLTAQFVTGASCFGPGVSYSCATAAGSEAGQAVLGETTNPQATAGASWSATAIPNTPSSSSYEAGVTATTAPVSVDSTKSGIFTTPVGTSSCGSGGTCGWIGPLFPFQSGYQVGAGICGPAEPTISVPTASQSWLPGTAALGSSTPTVTLPLGLLPIDVVNSTTGQPISGATVKLTLDNATSACNGPSPYTMPSTGSDGVTREQVIEDTYSVQVTVGANTYSPGYVTVSPGTTSYMAPSLTSAATVQIDPSTQVVAVP